MWQAISSDSGNDLCLRIYAEYPVVYKVRDKDISSRIDSQARRVVQLCGYGRYPIFTEPLFSCSRYDNECVG